MNGKKKLRKNQISAKTAKGQKREEMWEKKGDR